MDKENNIKDHKSEHTLKLINVLRSVIPQTYNVTETLMQLLNISYDSAYRRAKGITSLTLDEAILICNTYKIPLNDFLNLDGTSNVTFEYNNQNLHIKSLEMLEDTHVFMAQFMKKMAANTSTKVYLTARSFPIHYIFSNEKLTEFYFFGWMKNIYNMPEFRGKKYNPAMISDKLKEAARQQSDSYMQIESVELWAECTYRSLFKQILFYKETGIFNNRNQALDICNQAEEVFTQIREKAKHSSKLFDPNNPDVKTAKNFELYSYELQLSNNVVITETETEINLRISNNMASQLVTKDYKYIKDMKAIFFNQLDSSVNISGISEIHRHRYFTDAFKLLDQVRNKILK